MAVPVAVVKNQVNYLRYPELPPLPSEAGQDLVAWYQSLQGWYNDLRLLLQRDREDTLAKINKLS